MKRLKTMFETKLSLSNIVLSLGLMTLMLFGIVGSGVSYSCGQEQSQSGQTSEEISSKREQGMQCCCKKPMEMESMPSMGMGYCGVRMMGKVKGLWLKQSSVPGIPGASHLYHIGATDFFLDHAKLIILTDDQKDALNTIKEQELLKMAAFNRQIDEAEQELWSLTSADQPDEEQIKAKIHDIEELCGNKRSSFIHSVGEAVKVLTAEQRQALTGKPYAPTPAGKL